MPKKIKPPKPGRGARIETRESVAPNSDDLPPVFSFEHMADTHCVTACEQQEQAAFAEALFRRGRLPWKELRQAPRHGLGYEKIDRLNVQLPKTVTEDVSIIAFRCIGKAPMIGYRDGRVFHILFIDRAFDVYDHS